MAKLKTVIEIAADTAAAEKGIGQVSDQLERLTGAIKRVGHYGAGIFTLAEVAQGVKALGALSDQYRNLEGRVKLAAGSQNQFTEAQRALFAIAQNNAQALTGVSQLYSRIAKGAGEMGVSQQQVLSVIDSVAKSFRVSGASAEEASGATLQFSQALASGVLRGDEFNSIMEQSPRLAQAIADGLDVPIGKLRALAEAGELTTQKVVGALAEAKASIDADAAGLPDTIEQAVVRWDNAVMKYVGTSPAITHAAEAIADAINGAAENIDGIAAGVETVGTVIAAVLIGKASGAAAAFSVRMLQTAADTAKATLAAREHALAEDAAAKAMLAASEAALVEARGKAALAGAAAGASGAAYAAAGVVAAEQAVAAASARVAAAEAAVAAASTGMLSRIGGVLKGVIGFLGGPVGIVASLAVAAASWKLFGSTAENELERVARKRRELAKDAGLKPSDLGASDETLQDKAQLSELARKKAEIDKLAKLAGPDVGGGLPNAQSPLMKRLEEEKRLLAEMVTEYNKRKAVIEGDQSAQHERELAKSFAETKNALKDAAEQAETWYKRRLAAINAIERIGLARITQTLPKQPIPGESSTLGGTAPPNDKARTELEQTQAVFRLQQQAEQARLTAMRDYANQRLALVGRVYGRELAKYKDGEDKKTQLERESLQARRAIHAELEAAYAATVDKLIAQERRLRDEAVAAAKERRDIELETAQAVKSMAQGAATPAEAARAQYLELQRLMAEQQSALAAGNLDLSKQAGNQAKGIAEALGQRIASALRDVKQRIADLAKEKAAAETGQTADQRQKAFIGQNDARNLIGNADPVRQFIAGASGPTPYPSSAEPPKPEMGTQADLRKLIQLRQEIGRMLADVADQTGKTATGQAEQTAQQIQTALQAAQSVGAEIDEIDQKLARGFDLKVQADPAALQALRTQLQELLKPETKVIKVVVQQDGNSITATRDGADTGLTVPGFRRGGWIRGYGGGDRIPALLEEGEFVLRKEAVRKLGLDKLYALNNLAIPRFSIGGYVARAVPAFDASLARADGGQPVHLHLPGVPGSFALDGSQEVVQALKREVARAALKHGRIVR